MNRRMWNARMNWACKQKKYTQSVPMLDEKHDMGELISDHFPCNQTFLRFSIIKWPRHRDTTNEGKSLWAEAPETLEHHWWLKLWWVVWLESLLNIGRQKILPSLKRTRLASEKPSLNDILSLNIRHNATPKNPRRYRPMTRQPPVTNTSQHMTKQPASVTQPPEKPQQNKTDTAQILQVSSCSSQQQQQQQ